jgi:hypothetical protein
MGNEAWMRALFEEYYEPESGVIYPQVTLEQKLRVIDSCLLITNYNKVTFVPKDAKTERAIAIEAQINVLLQLSVGAYLKRRLHSVGCDLKSQQRNQELAWIGSIFRDRYDPVTLDLAMASDTLCIELVRELLPPDWYDFLDGLRAREGRHQNTEFVWEKFSSMGNGFTFELETLIFYALAQACSDLNGTTHWFHDTFGRPYRYAYVSVFGDDIIVPQVDSQFLIDVLRYCGFRVNRDKSFVLGPFRESCGEDFFNGDSVRALYATEGIEKVKDLILLLNGLTWLEFKYTLPLSLTKATVRSLIPGVVSHHLLGSTPTRSNAYIWVTPDEVHRSKLVIYDPDVQRFLEPVIKVTPETFNNDADLRWRYVQGLNSLPFTPPDDADPKVDIFSYHVVGGGSRFDVVRSGTVSHRLGLT